MMITQNGETKRLEHAMDAVMMLTAVATRVGVAADHAFPVLTAALTGAAFRTAMIRWATAGTDGHLSKFVGEAFGLLKSGLNQNQEVA